MLKQENSFYTEEELKELGLKEIGINVLISRKCSLYGIERIRIGNHVRIDDFVIISGNVEIGNYVHISAGTYLYGGNKGIYINDYCTISGRCGVYAVSDNYLGDAMANPMISDEYRKVQEEQVVMEKHVLLGAGSIVLPGVHLGEGSSFGALSMINKSTNPWTVYKGIPAKVWKERKRMPLEMEKEFVNNQNISGRET